MAFRDRAAHFFDFVHQRRLRVEAARRVDEEKVGPALARRGRRVECDGGGVGSLFSFDDACADSRLPHTSSCWTAAARNVSPAASTTRRPVAMWRVASLPMVVVLPTPFTPTMRTTVGCAERRSGPPPSDRIRMASERSAAQTADASVVRSRSTVSRRRARMVAARLRASRRSRAAPPRFCTRRGGVDLFFAFEERRELRDEASPRRRETLPQPCEVSTRRRHLRRGVGRRRFSGRWLRRSGDLRGRLDGDDVGGGGRRGGAVGAAEAGERDSLAGRAAVGRAGARGGGTGRGTPTVGAWRLLGVAFPRSKNRRPLRPRR